MHGSDEKCINLQYKISLAAKQTIYKITDVVSIVVCTLQMIANSFAVALLLVMHLRLMQAEVVSINWQ